MIDATFTHSLILTYTNMNGDMLVLIYLGNGFTGDWRLYDKLVIIVGRIKPQCQP